MLKVLHTGDWHIGSFPGPEVGGQNARFQDICRCLDFQAMYAEEHRPDLIVVSGDIFHQARVWSDRGLRESRTAIYHIRRLSNVAPTVVLRGTPNHDSEEQFEMLTTAFYGDDCGEVPAAPPPGVLAAGRHTDRVSDAFGCLRTPGRFQNTFPSGCGTCRSTANRPPD